MNTTTAATMTPAERHALAYQLRSSGLTWVAIGKRLGITATRARDLAQRHEMRETRKTLWFHGLDDRTVGLLERANLDSRELVLEAYKSGTLQPGTNPRYYGWTAHKTVAKWLGLPEPFKTKRLCPHCGKPIGK